MSVFIIMIVSMLLVVTIPQTNAQFVLSESDFPDEYGQGIEELYLYENSTGSWVAYFGGDGRLIFPEENDQCSAEISYSANTAIEFIIGVSINHTLLALSTKQEALNIIRVNIVVTSTGNELFSQNNITHGGGVLFNKTATTWLTFYDIIINILIESGVVYVVDITYEIWSE